MKLKLLALAAFFPAIVSAQAPNFSLSGKINTPGQSAKVYIDYMDNGVSHEDSTILKDGVFKFSGMVKNIAFARMALDHTGEGKQHAIYAPGNDVIYFYFGKENVQLSSDKLLSDANVTGSEIYDEYQAYNKQIGGTIMDLSKAANADFASGTPEQQQDSSYVNKVSTRYRESMARRSGKQLEFAGNNPHSFFGLVALSESAGVNVDVAKIAPLFNALDVDLRQTDIGRELEARMQAGTITAIGKAAPVFTQTDVDGKPVSLTGLKGKLVLVEFWASWCTACRAGNPNLIKQYQLYKDKGFEIISVSLDDNKGRWVNAIAEDQLPWIQVSDLKGWNNAVGRLYGIRSVPQSFLIDRDGTIIGNTLRDETLNKKLAEVFKN